eukprot:5357002-Amphidinium_carterae.1
MLIGSVIVLIIDTKAMTLGLECPAACAGFGFKQHVLSFVDLDGQCATATMAVHSPQVGLSAVTELVSLELDDPNHGYHHGCLSQIRASSLKWPVLAFDTSTKLWCKLVALLLRTRCYVPGIPHPADEKLRKCGSARNKIYRL